MVTASCEADAEAWNSATGSRPTAQKAHRDRVARRIASQTIATYAASAARRDASTIPSIPAPAARATRIAAAWGRYGTGDPKVEKVTKRCEGSVGHAGIPRSDTGVDPLDGVPSRRALCSSTTRPSRSTPRTTSGGMHAPLNSEPSGCSGRKRPVEIWYERKKWAGSSMPPKWGTTHARYGPDHGGNDQEGDRGVGDPTPEPARRGRRRRTRGSTLALEVDGRGGGSQSLVRRPKRPTPCNRDFRSSRQGIRPTGRLPFMHGSRPAPSDPRAGRGVDLLDVGLLALPVLLAVLAFVLANLL